jgi:hypothetical protein
MRIVTTFSTEGLGAFRAGIGRLGVDGPAMMAEFLNVGGLALREKTIAAETKQTGLDYKDAVRRAQKVIPASLGNLSFSTRVEGGNIRLKFFGAKEGGGGVTANPWGHSKFYPGAWLTSGPQGNRRPVPRLNGQVFNASGYSSWWKPFTGPVRSGVLLPDELVKGETLEAFDAGAVWVLDGVMTKLAAMV